jgi:hypothetical protein
VMAKTRDGANSVVIYQSGGNDTAEVGRDCGLIDSCVWYGARA